VPPFAPVNQKIPVRREIWQLSFNSCHADETRIGQTHRLVGVFAEKIQNVRAIFFHRKIQQNRFPLQSFVKMFQPPNLPSEAKIKLLKQLLHKCKSVRRRNQTWQKPSDDVRRSGRDRIPAARCPPKILGRGHSRSGGRVDKSFGPRKTAAEVFGQIIQRRGVSLAGEMLVNQNRARWRRANGQAIWLVPSTTRCACVPFST